MKTSLLPAIALAALLPLGAIAQTQVPGEHFIDNWDLDGDGQVTLAEATEKRSDLFFMFDTDENGSLDDAEYQLFDETRQADMDTNAGGHKKGAMRGVNQGMTKAYNDTNGDGLVSEEEFLSHTPDWFTMVDRNADNLITTDDFGRGNNG
ncbi:MAG: EF-hand domain-containing protein [Rhodobacteraceae bacterium]|nr:EF-hand domain-containing protein [Paracoccaceae bacterium]